MVHPEFLKSKCLQCLKQVFPNPSIFLDLGLQCDGLRFTYFYRFGRLLHLYAANSPSKGPWICVDVSSTFKSFSSRNAFKWSDGVCPFCSGSYANLLFHFKSHTCTSRLKKLFRIRFLISYILFCRGLS